MATSLTPPVTIVKSETARSSSAKLICVLVRAPNRRSTSAGSSPLSRVTQ
ncbi:hypothetical protein [Streptosporangium subroseum]|nr:hypothetical protein OHB15_24450 [Streptosporangium subroseum]